MVGYDRVEPDYEDGPRRFLVLAAEGSLDVAMADEGKHEKRAKRKGGDTEHTKDATGKKDKKSKKTTKDAIDKKHKKSKKIADMISVCATPTFHAAPYQFSKRW